MPDLITLSIDKRVSIAYNMIEFVCSVMVCHTWEAPSAVYLIIKGAWEDINDTAGMLCRPRR